LASHLPSQFLQRLGTPTAVILLPALGFYAERTFDEPITDPLGPALYALYALGLFAYASTLFGRLPAKASSISAGILGTGSAISAILGLVGAAAALFILLGSLPWRGPPRSSYERLSQFGMGLVLAMIALSPWLTSFALGKAAARALRTSATRLGKSFGTAWMVVGVALVLGAMSVAQKGDSYWLAARVRAFETDDIARWEESLNEIKNISFVVIADV
jgi:hypothetical protein